MVSKTLVLDLNSPCLPIGHKSCRWSGFNPDLVDSTHSIRTWDVFRIVENNKVCEVS
jgi:hypothetical protein